MSKDYRQRKDDVWKKASKIRGKSSAKYRKDKLGNVMYYGSYGKDTGMGWQIDHSKPRSKGGTHHLNNLQALNTSANKSKGNKYK